jgi:hypothetical protein
MATISLKRSTSGLLKEITLALKDKPWKGQQNAFSEGKLSEKKEFPNKVKNES